MAALGDRLHPGLLHVLFAKNGFSPQVDKWAGGNRARLLIPADMLAPFAAAAPARGG